MQHRSPNSELTLPGATSRIRGISGACMSAKPVLTGDLSSVALADVISLLNISRKTGMLRCTRGAETRTVFWEQGEIVFARSNSVRDNLGCFLVRRGLISEEQN